jgi:hypothetical protein
LEGRRFYNIEELEVAVGEWLLTQQPDLYRDGIFKFGPTWVKCISVLRDYVEKHHTSVKQMS